MILLLLIFTITGKAQYSTVCGEPSVKIEEFNIHRSGNRIYVSTFGTAIDMPYGGMYSTDGTNHLFIDTLSGIVRTIHFSSPDYTFRWVGGTKIRTSE